MASRVTCTARLISDGVEVMLSAPSSRIEVIRARSEGEISDSLASGNMARRRSTVDIWDSRRSGGRGWEEVMAIVSILPDLAGPESLLDPN